MAQSDESSRTVLQRIATALDVSVEQFMSGDLSAGATIGAAECLRLWSLIRTDEGRFRALEALRTIAEAPQKEA